jgi:hypothetical protein
VSIGVLGSAPGWPAGVSIGVFIGVSGGVSSGVLGSAENAAPLEESDGVASGVVGSEVDSCCSSDCTFSGVVGSEVDFLSSGEDSEGAGEEEDVPDVLLETPPPPGLGVSCVALESLPPAPEEAPFEEVVGEVARSPFPESSSGAPDLASLESEGADLCAALLPTTTGSATAEPSSPAALAQLAREPTRRNTATTKRGARFITTTLSGELTN